MTSTNYINLLELIGHDTTLKRVASTNGGEYAGPCPFCGGEDRFRVWPNQDKPGFWCRYCNKSGDAISYVRQRDNIGYLEACAVLSVTPSERTQKQSPKRPEIFEKSSSAAVALSDEDWQANAQAFCIQAVKQLWGQNGRAAREYLIQRGFEPSLLQAMNIGYNPKSQYAQWGTTKVYVSDGIVIPWYFCGKILKINVRRMDERKPKYLQVTGGANGLYRADTITANKIIVMVEGEFDALSVQQALNSSDAITAVATGSVDGAKLLKWLIRVASSKGLLLAFDNDNQGDTAAQWWKAHLDQMNIPNIRLTPEQHDVNEMLKIGNDIQTWLQTGTNRLFS